MFHTRNGTPPHQMKPLPPLLASGSVAHADLFVTNFTAINGTTSATGTWRNETTATDLPAFPVTLSQSGGSIKPADGSSTQSIINPTGTDPYNLWQDVPAVPGLNPGAVSTWSGAISTLGDHRFFQGVYTP